MDIKFSCLSAFSLILLSCGQSANPTDQAGSSTPDITKDPIYQKGFTLVKESDCLTCHQVADKAIGPSYKEIAQKYASVTDQELSAVAQKIIKGGAGVWGQVPMTPHPSLSSSDAEAMLQYILLLK